MMNTNDLEAEVELARRMAQQLDGTSQQVLGRYLREVEYDLVYRAAGRTRRVTI